MLSFVAQFLCYSSGMQTWREIWKYSIILNGQFSWNTDLVLLPGKELEEIFGSEKNLLNFVVRSAMERLDLFFDFFFSISNWKSPFFFKGSNWERDKIHQHPRKRTQKASPKPRVLLRTCTVPLNIICDVTMVACHGIRWMIIDWLLKRKPFSYFLVLSLRLRRILYWGNQ